MDQIERINTQPSGVRMYSRYLPYKHAVACRKKAELERSYLQVAGYGPVLARCSLFPGKLFASFIMCDTDVIEDTEVPERRVTSAVAMVMQI